MQLLAYQLEDADCLRNVVLFRHIQHLSLSAVRKEESTSQRNWSTDEVNAICSDLIW